MREAGHATRKRLLDAAREELAAHGAAGARINRIAANAHASKDRLYAYFPSKEELVAEVMRLWLLELEAAAQPVPDDMPGYVGRLFDHFAQSPQDGRLLAWAELDPGFEESTAEVNVLQSAVDAVRTGQATGAIDPAWEPVDLVRLLIGIARSMGTPSGTRSGRPRTVEQRRAAAVAAAARLVNGGPA